MRPLPPAVRGGWTRDTDEADDRDLFGICRAPGYNSLHHIAMLLVQNRTYSCLRGPVLHREYERDKDADQFTTHLFLLP